MATDTQIRDSLRAIIRVLSTIEVYESYSATDSEKRAFLTARERDDLLTAFKIIIDHVFKGLPV